MCSKIQNIESSLSKEHLVSVVCYPIVALCLLTLVACGSGGDGDDDAPPPPKIAGIWSGTWEGIDSEFGPAAGTWEASISQQGVDVRGPISFGGDIDCAEGKMTGTADGETEIVSGKVHREPCPFNDWIFTAFNQDEFIASGTWEKQGLSNGSFEGKRVAKFTGPQIKYIHPSGGLARGFVTIVGEGLDMDPVNDILTLGSGGPVLVPTTVSDTVITLKLPGNVSHPDHFVLKTNSGEALSTRVFNTRVTTPNTGTTQVIPIGSGMLQLNGIVFSVNGRRAFVANVSEGSVSMINSEMGQESTSTVVLPGPTPANPVYSVAIGPAGRNVYVAGHNVIGVLHAHTMELLRTETIPSNGSIYPNPQGIAVSPDGRWLLVSEAIEGGRVTILDIKNQFKVSDTLEMDGGNIPRGIATSPDNTVAYIAVSGNDNEIWVYEFASAMVTSRISIGTSPASIAVTPDANQLFITNAPADSVNYYNIDSGFSSEIDLPFGVSPHSIAISPDGFTVYVTSNTNDIYLIDVISHLVRPINVGGPTAGVAISPDGKRAYVTQTSGNKVVEIGNQRTLRISKQGGGIGIVNLAEKEVSCGGTCIATFGVGSRVYLSTIADQASDSEFKGWDGDADCKDGVVTMSSNLFCVARFDVRPTPPTRSGSGSSNCFIATAAYGSWLDPHVLTLREFRDQHLLTNSVGTWFVEFYYRHSPPIADYIREREGLRVTVRSALAIVIYTIEYPVVAGLTWILLLLTMIRRRKTLVALTC
jgi:DNA-binding beta-propeller fold protein YncE